MIYPLKEYMITQTYQEHVDNANYMKMQYNLQYYNPAIDFITRGSDKNIYSVDIGTVTDIKYDTTGYGTHVRVKYAWGVAIYAHLSSVKVSVGQSVLEGTTLGVIGNTGASSGEHLHLEFRDNNGICFDPDKLLIKSVIVKPSGVYTITNPATITADYGVYMRRSPSRTGDILTLLPKGSKIEMTDKTYSDGIIKWRGVVVWVAEELGGEKLILKDL